jgi:hypothetical protein
MDLDATLLEVGPGNVSWGGVQLGFMGDTLAYKVGTTAITLTGAQTGTVPQKKIVSGGHFIITVPFKEITNKNLGLGIPNAVLVNPGMANERLEFRVRVGLDLRSLAQAMVIKKVIGGIESTLPKDITVIPLCSPVDAEVVVDYNPQAQRIILATFEAWPDSTGLWAYQGVAP